MRLCTHVHTFLFGLLHLFFFPSDSVCPLRGAPTPARRLCSPRPPANDVDSAQRGCDSVVAQTRFISRAPPHWYQQRASQTWPSSACWQ